MMDYRMGPTVLEQRPVINTGLLDAAQEELEKWDAIEWGFGNLLPLVSHVAHLDDSDEDVRTRAHDYLSTILETDGGYPPVAYAFSFVRLESHLNNSLANWEVPSPTISAIFNGEATRLHPEALSCIPDISRATFEEHAAISDTVDLEAQIAHAAYLVSMLKNSELDQVARFRAAAKLLSFHIPYFAVRGGEKRKIAQECYNVAIETIRSFEGIPEDTLNTFLETMDYQPDRKSQRATKWFLHLSGLSPYQLLDVNKRMDARENHMGEDHVTVRAQLEVESRFPGSNKLLSQYYKVSRWAGRLLVVPDFLDTPPASRLLNDKNLPEVTVISAPYILDEDINAIINSCDPTFLNNKAIKAILDYARERHQLHSRRDGTNHYEGHVGALVVGGVIEAIANGRVYTPSKVAIDAFHDIQEDAEDDEKEQVRAKLFEIQAEYNLNFMTEVDALTKDPRLRGLAADIEQAERLKEASPESRAGKLRDRKINLMTDRGKASRRKGGAFKQEEIDYWTKTGEIFGEVFEMEPETKAKWRLIKKIFAYHDKKYPVVTR